MTFDAESARLNDLIHRCAKSYKHGRTQPAPILNPDEKFNVQFLVATLPRLTLSELALVVSASQVRARALVLSRAGDVGEARIALDRARSVSAASRLSREATIIDRSFQEAADAYLQYKTHNYSGAETSLRVALECCRTLRDEFGYSVDGRRIHLVRNIVRVRRVAGLRTEALDLACLMVRYIEGDTECWPFPELQVSAERDVLATEDRLVLLDQLLSEISRLLAAGRETGALLTRAGQALFSEHAGLDTDVARARVRISALRALAENDLMGFLDKAVVFLWDGPGYMPQGWREMSQEFIDICRDLAPTLIDNLDAEHEYQDGK